MKKEEFFKKKMVIGMVHLLPLPANAAYRGDKQQIIDWALEDAKVLIDAGVDAIMLENFSDWPQYADEIPLESYTLMTAIASKIRDICPIPFGVNVEMNAWKQEWLMAWACNADFIRIEAFVDNRGGSFGYIPACSTPISKVMVDYPAEIMLFTDVHTQETYGNPNVPINQLCHNAKNHDSSGIIVTENDNNERITVEDVKSMREEMGDFPIIVGSGVKTHNVLDYLEYADGVIVGRGFKTGDRIDAGKVKEFMDIVHSKY
ncbi:MAG: BtpA/SgcQ family protein [Erysipelotrichaceae bacterium]|nr:BtpA/SgcQ family protein [Erysipelotrichaceae bacterium]